QPMLLVSSERRTCTPESRFRPRELPFWLIGHRTSWKTFRWPLLCPSPDRHINSPVHIGCTVAVSPPDHFFVVQFFSFWKPVSINTFLSSLVAVDISR